MTQADSALSPSGQSERAAFDLPKSIDLLIAGGGIMGLWAAVKAERAGISTLLLDGNGFGSGASGGLLGALMPHMPDRWSDKKQFQFDALVDLEEEIHQLESETDRHCGYRRCGRLIPLPKPHLRPIAERHSQDAKQVWRAGTRSFEWNLLDQSPDPAWLSTDIGSSGVVQDTLAARVSPRALVGALVSRLQSARFVRVLEGLSIESIGSDDVMLSNGERLSFGHLIVAAGHRSFPLLQQLGPPLSVPLGVPVKGQAALLKADVDPALPVLFLNGLYVVAHEGGHVAVGSTSEDVFDDPVSTDEKLDDLIARAIVLSPALAESAVVERWAGLRPKAIDRDPMVGPHPEAPRVIALTGGFKVSFGLAHHLAEVALEPLTGVSRPIPRSFHFEQHLRVVLTSS